MFDRSQHLILEGWFLHVDQILRLLGGERASAATASLPSQASPLGKTYWAQAIEEALAQYLREIEVTSLAVAVKDDRLEKGMLVWLDQALYFKGLATAARSGGRANFKGKLDTDTTTAIVGDFNPERVMSSTGSHALSGRSRQFLLGYITEHGGDEVTLRPLFIGQRYLRPIGDKGLPFADRAVRDTALAHPAQVDAFAHVDFSRALNLKDLQELRDVPERQVKTWFAEIFGEPDVPKDWGGEQFDLWTAQVTIGREHVQTAIAFKGPALFRPMTIAHLGHNGDQIDRLFATAADLLVVQHCHSITAPVVNMLRIYATHPSHVRRYMTINGYQTLAILRHFGYLTPS
ncbi:hypothetical protein [Nocardioides currus]|uniref:Uncharacterized protein n=1 Tax=Nocardioides currus TaxID=2133958 RepID=A0A2R7YYU6_9ACTN|nr:hypothetical protein [Nocardioides currus]PUA81059.1 hypothetical protein C7S10_11840 [Nocardioides currus]